MTDSHANVNQGVDDEEKVNCKKTLDKKRGGLKCLFWPMTILIFLMAILTLVLLVGTFTVTSKQIHDINKKLKDQGINERVTKGQLTIVKYYSCVVLVILMVLGWLLNRLWLACREKKVKIIDTYVIIFMILFLVALGVGAYSENKIIMLKSYRMYLYSSIAGALIVFVFLYYIHSFANQLRMANSLGFY